MKGTRWVLRREKRSNPPDLSDVIFARTREDIEKVPKILENYLSDRGLVLAEDKTKITHIS
ncbi:MAG: hypothetical protein IJJ10_15435, partial [Bacillus sp. (in: Bacteria)]|nr:hypothetical protein [Bacillus sp. (in: firmicutes)]